MKPKADSSFLVFGLFGEEAGGRVGGERGLKRLFGTLCVNCKAQNLAGFYFVSNVHPELAESQEMFAFPRYSLCLCIYTPLFSDFPSLSLLSAVSLFHPFLPCFVPLLSLLSPPSFSFTTSRTRVIDRSRVCTLAPVFCFFFFFHAVHDLE